MAFPQGIDFCTSGTFVTHVSPSDPETNAPLSGGQDYPRTTAQGNSVGYDVGDPTACLQCRDRNSGIDPRLASNHGTSGADLRFRLDLPAAGAYLIRSSCGDANYATNALLEVFDTSSSLGTLSVTATSAPNKYRDATDTEYTAAAWPGSNTGVSKTFTTTICRFLLANGNTTVTHVYLESAGGAAAPASGIQRGQSRRQRAGWSVSSPGGFF